MDLHQALSQLDAIHAHVSRTETFRGYRPLTVATQGLLAIAAAGWQALAIADPANHVDAWLQLWVGVAVFAFGMVSVDLAVECWRSPSQFARRQTWQAVEQFLPCIAVGATLTWTLWQFAPTSLPLLPGLWSVVFSLGIFSSARQLPAAVVWVAIYYLVTGLAAVALARGEQAFTPWAMLATFGVGQLLTALVLHQGRQTRTRQVHHG